MDLPVSPGRELDAADHRRVARNQATLRIVNEGIGADGQRTHLAFVCECGRIGCNRVIMLAPGEYEAVRADPRRFVVVPGHEVTALEHVVELHAGHAVVETRHHARDVAERTDPRRGAAAD